MRANDTAPRSTPQSASAPEGLPPAGVVAAQMAAFSVWNSDPAAADRAYSYASAANHKNIGPVENYRRLLTRPPFVGLVDNRGWLAGNAVKKDQGVAAVLVTVVDRSGSLRVYRYLLVMSQENGVDRWFVDTVLPVPVVPGAAATKRGNQEPGGPSNERAGVRGE